MINVKNDKMWKLSVFLKEDTHEKSKKYVNTNYIPANKANCIMDRAFQSHFREDWIREKRKILKQ